ncbi:MAG: methionyl-tRNA formyltransferase [Dehalococcoidales bacterium]|nr:MAG: methionyl-tRNA formyltransferase [Dehalococcoidales bacterium]
MNIVFMGTPEFAVPSLTQLVSNQYQVVAVYTQPDRASGRGRSLISNPVKKAALGLGLNIMQPVGLKDAGEVQKLASFRPEVIVVAALGQILPKSVLDIPAYGCINIHPSLLPEFRGATPIAAAILAGKQFTGVSLMLLDRGMDTGPVLAQAQISVSPQDTAASLTSKLSRVAAQLLSEILPRWLKRGISPRKQEGALASYTGMLAKEDGEIDWQLPAVDIWRRVRAYYPWPGTYTRWQGRQLRIIEAVPLAGGGMAKVGQVVIPDSGKAALGIGTSDGVLGILRVQLEGKKAMPADEFLRGQRQLIGAVLPSE